MARRSAEADYSDNPVRDAISGAKESIQQLLQGKTQAGGEE